LGIAQIWEFWEKDIDSKHIILGIRKEMQVLCNRNYKLYFLYTTNLILMFDFISTEHGIFNCILIEAFSKQEKYGLMS
jgi:hypothetical protein